MSEEYKKPFQNIQDLGLTIHEFSENNGSDWILAEDLEKLLAVLHRIYYHPTGKKSEGSLSPKQRSEDRYTALLLDIKRIEKPKPKRKVTLYKWELIDTNSNGNFVIHQRIAEQTPYDGWTKVPGSERVIEVDDE